jgi:ribonuclease PH
MSQRTNSKRRNDELRPILITYHLFSNADASVLFELGNTKVLCAVTMQTGVPHFLRGKGTGWLNAEYAMLPTATTVRTQRESTNASRTGRSVEISRLIGRTLRTVVDCSGLGERTIYVDCDVLQADGGTRVAAITAASLVLRRAQQIWLSKKIITAPILMDDIAAVSVGVKDSDILLDPDYAEDSSIDADFNFISTRSGKMIEIHGGAERAPIEWELFDKARVCALQAMSALFKHVADADMAVQSPYVEKRISATTDSTAGGQESSPLFSLKNRFASKQNV